MPGTRRKRRRLHTFAIIVLTILSLVWFTFALLSGSQELGGGLTGLLRNSPNALPWVIILALVLLADRHPVIGGSVFVIVSAAATLFFRTYDHPATFATITLPYFVLGLILVITGLKRWWSRPRY